MLMHRLKKTWQFGSSFNVYMGAPKTIGDGKCNGKNGISTVTKNKTNSTTTTTRFQSCTWRLLRFENFHPRSSLTTQGLDVSHKEVNVSREGPF